MGKTKSKRLDKVVLDGVPYEIEINSFNPDVPLPHEAMIVFSEQKVVLNEYLDRPKSDFTRMNDLFHEMTHGAFHHRLSNCHVIDRATHEEQERIVQELGTFFMNTLIDSPQLLEALQELAKQKK